MRAARAALCCLLAAVTAVWPSVSAAQVVSASRSAGPVVSGNAFNVGTVRVGQATPDPSGPGLSLGVGLGLPGAAAPAIEARASGAPVSSAWNAPILPQGAARVDAPAAGVGPVVLPPASFRSGASPGGALLQGLPLAEASAAASAPKEARGLAAPESVGAERAAWERFWSGGAKRDELAVPTGRLAWSQQGLAAPSEPSGAKAAEPPSPGERPSPASSLGASAVKSLGAPAVLGGLYAAVRFGLPTWLPAIWTKSEPYVAAGGLVAATLAAQRLARAGIGLLGRKAHWQPSTIVAVRLASSVVLWSLGGALALHAVGVTTAALLTSFGIGGVAMTMAAKDFIGNFLEGVKQLANRPFIINDRIRIGDKSYTVKDMNLRYMELAREDGGTTMLTYTQLAEKAVTVMGEYAGRKAALSLERARGLWRDVYGIARAASRPTLLASSLWTVLGLGLSVALPFLPALAPLGFVASWLPYVQGACTLLAARAIETGANGFIRRLAERRGWNPQRTVVLRLGVQIAAYVIGGSIALRFFGMTWTTLLASLGATSIALGWASADVIGNIIQGFWILMTHPFTIGDKLEIGSVTGTVIDMNLNYVVLQHGDGSFTLVPYAVVKGSPFTVLPR